MSTERDTTSAVIYEKEPLNGGRTIHRLGRLGVDDILPTVLRRCHSLFPFTSTQTSSPITLLPFSPPRSRLSLLILACLRAILVFETALLAHYATPPAGLNSLLYGHPSFHPDLRHVCCTARRVLASDTHKPACPARHISASALLPPIGRAVHHVQHKST